MIASVVRRDIRHRNSSEKIEYILSGGKTRLNECHSFEWSRTLWREASDFITKLTSTLLAVYVAIACYGCYVDGLRGVDIPYVIATTLTTIGLGDMSPSKQSTRLASVAMLPFGLIVLSFGIANVQAFLQSITPVKRDSQLPPPDERTNDNRIPLSRSRSKLLTKIDLAIRGDKSAKRKLAWKAFKGSFFFQTLVLLRSYITIILIGAVFFRFFEREQQLQKENADTDMTWVDSFFFATVVSTTVGYGHIIAPQSDGAKIFCIFYFFVSTTIVGNFINSFAGLWGSKKQEEVYSAIIDSTVWVHRADLHQTGFIFQSDYVLFKLRQMQAVDDNDVEVLTYRFHELDDDDSGLLTVGIDVPSAEQVKQLQASVEESNKSLVQAWKEFKAANNLHDEVDELALDRDTGVNPTKLLHCHTFEWSRSLYFDTWKETTKFACACFAAYLVLGYLTMAYLDESIAGESWGSLEGWYFLSATLSTVGLGDYAPESQLTRGFAIIMIPSGLLIISLTLSANSQYKLSRPYKVKKDPLSTRLTDARRLFDRVDLKKTGKLTRDQVILSAPLLKRTAEQAGALFDSLNLDGDDLLELTEIKAQEKTPLFETIPARCSMLIVKMFLVIFVGALFFKLHGPEAENNLTWIDALYLGTVVSTSIGYGDIVPASFGGKLFLLFYMLGSTIVMGNALGEMIALFVNDIVGASINAKIIESTTWLHKVVINDGSMDTKGPYFHLTEADYVIFKLMQMQKIDHNLMDRLIDRFIELDSTGARSLVLGIDIPNKLQVEEMQKLTSGTGMTLQEAWNKHLDGFCHLKAEPMLVLPDNGPDEHMKINGESKSGTDKENPAKLEGNAAISTTTLRYQGPNLPPSPDQLSPYPGVPSLPFSHQPFAGDTDRFDGIRTMSTGFFEASRNDGARAEETRHRRAPFSRLHSNRYHE